MFAYGNMKVADLILGTYNLNVVDTSYSAIKDSVFSNNVGLEASAIYLDASKLYLIGTNVD